MRVRLVSTILLLALSGCATSSPTPLACTATSIELEAVALPVSVASTAMGVGNVIAALGAEEALLASDLGSSVGAEIINPGHQIDVERLIAKRPDVIFIDESEPDETALDAMSKIGARVISLPAVSNLEQSYMRNIAVAEALNLTGKGEELNQKIRSAISMVDTSLLHGKKMAFLYLRGSAGIYLLGGEGSGADDLIEQLGGVDVGSLIGVTGFAPIGAESLLAANPEILIVMQKGLESIGGPTALFNLPGVAGTIASKEQALLVGEDSDLLSFGPMTPKVLACLAEQARP